MKTFMSKLCTVRCSFVPWTTLRHTVTIKVDHGMVQDLAKLDGTLVLQPQALTTIQ